MIVKSRLYKLVATALSLSLLAALIPRPIWAQIAGIDPVKIVYADANMPQSGLVSSSFNDAQKNMLQDLENILPSELSQKLIGIQNLTSITPMETYKQIQPPGSPSILDNPLSVMRTQSAYIPSAAISNTLYVTLTVANNLPPANLPQIDSGATVTETLSVLAGFDFANDPNVIYNVLLTDEFLSPQTALISSSPQPGYQSGEYAWSLGDIPPMGSVTMTFQLTFTANVTGFTVLDVGANAWGTWQNRAVNASTAPITISPDGFGGWLTCTIDANCNDQYIIKKAAELGNDPIAIFSYVRSLGYESYKGSLRGARGTLWSAAGNSVDQANLLVAMLRASGIPAGYRHGMLDIPLAQQLVGSMFVIPQGTIGYLPSNAIISDPLNNPELIAEVQDHWWVQAYLADQGWVHLDPSFANATVDTFFVSVPDPEPLTEVPDALRHKVTIKLQTENYHPLNVASSGLQYSYPFNVTYRTAELIGNPVTFSHVINTNSQSGFVFAWVQHTYIPYLIVGDRNELVEGHAYQELISNFPFGTFLYTGAWLTFEIRDPDGNLQTYKREVFDRIGFEGRQVGGHVSLNLAGDFSAALNEFDSFTMVFDPNRIATDAIVRWETELIDAAAKLQPSFAEIEAVKDLPPENADVAQLRRLSNDMQQLVILQDRITAMQYVYTADMATENTAATLGVKAYHDTPRVIIASSTVANAAIRRSLDLRSDPVRTIVNPGQSLEHEFGFHSMRGVIATLIEDVILNGAGLTVFSAAAILEQATIDNIPLVYIDKNRLDELAQLSISVEAKARIIASINNGFLVVVPERMVVHHETLTIAWWRINPDSGEVIGVGEDGTHQAITETGFLYSTKITEAQILYAFMLGLFAVLVLYILYLIEVLNISIAIPAPGIPRPAPLPGIDWGEVWRRVKERMQELSGAVQRSVPFGYSAP